MGFWNGFFGELSKSKAEKRAEVALYEARKKSGKSVGGFWDAIAHEQRKAAVIHVPKHQSCFSKVRQ
jgi:hypothetical protein